jgi:hypothetical protein
VRKAAAAPAPKLRSSVATAAGVEVAALAGEAGFIAGTAAVMIGITLLVRGGTSRRWWSKIGLGVPHGRKMTHLYPPAAGAGRRICAAPRRGRYRGPGVGERARASGRGGVVVNEQLWVRFGLACVRA